MAGHDATESARPVNAYPLMIPGAMYSRQQVIDMGVSANTLKKWEKAGLKIYYPDTKGGFVFADEAMAIIRKLG